MHIVKDIKRKARSLIELKKWNDAGRPLPGPHAVKARVVREYAERFSPRIMIETGTYHGQMPWAMRRLFDEIHTIELDDRLYKKNIEQFKDFDHIHVHHGDSGTVLGNLLQRINQPCLFWLDGHYSGPGTAKGVAETPIVLELQHVFKHPLKSHVILIDDAREFNGTHDYPTLDELKQWITQQQPHLDFEVATDIIRLTPRR